MGGGAWWAAVHGVTEGQTRLHFHFSLSCIGEGNGNPLQCSCLENPRDRGAWWTAVSGVAQSDTTVVTQQQQQQQQVFHEGTAGMDNQVVGGTFSLGLFSIPRLSELLLPSSPLKEGLIYFFYKFYLLGLIMLKLVISLWDRRL